MNILEVYFQQQTQEQMINSPAKVVMILLVSTRRIFGAPFSEKYIIPTEFNQTAKGLFRLVAVANPPSLG